MKKEKVKAFYSVSNSQTLETNINEWLADQNIEIIRVTQAASGRLDHHVTVLIFYKECV